MSDNSYQRYKWVRSQLETDVEYQYLLRRLGECAPAFGEAVAALSPDHRDAVMEYLGILAELDARVLELACFCPSGDS